MDKTGIHPGGEHAHVDARGHEEHLHEELGWWRRYVFSFDHKVIGIQYAITGLLFLLFGKIQPLHRLRQYSLAQQAEPGPVAPGQCAVGDERHPAERRDFAHPRFAAAFKMSRNQHQEQIWESRA